MKYRKNKAKCIILVFIIGLFFITACAASVLESKGKEVSYETPKVLKDTNLGAELPFIAYESEHLVIFYNYMGIFIYELDNSKMLHAIKLSDSQFGTATKGDNSTVVDVNIEDKTIKIYKVGNPASEYFFVYDINSNKLYQYSVEQLKKDEDQTKVNGRMDTDNWTAWSLSYTSKLTGKTYYPFRSIAE